MIFKCKNCGSNSVYDPERGTMYCPHCESVDSQEKIDGVSLTQCGNCGAPMEVPEFTSAMKCENCGSYHVFEERISGELTPHLILPFKISKEKAVQILKKEFGRRIFTPSTFLSHASVAQMEGSYVPFFLYDFHADADLSAQGTKVRSWTSGSYRYTETSYYAIERDMDVDFDNIPVDASKRLENSTMDLLEPYDYKALETFKEQYMSGFEGEVYSETAEELSDRAKQKAKMDVHALLAESISGYSSVTQRTENVRLTQKSCDYALLPVWIYDFSYQGKTYQFHVNGQTGKVIGKTPVAHKRVAGYSATVFALCLVVGFLLRVLEMLF